VRYGSLKLYQLDGTVLGMPRLSKLDRLLEAAARVVRRDGTDGFTLDAVAAEAGVSKGGLLYHFETKEALVRTLVERLVSSFDERLERERAKDRGPGSFTRAYARASIALEASADDGTASALVAATALAPSLLDPLRERYKRWSRALANDGIDPTRALLVRLAVDGLWFSDLLGFEPPGPRARKRLLDQLVLLAEVEK
jgi:AcrR family transcriptional regulator